MVGVSRITVLVSSSTVYMDESAASVSASDAASAAICPFSDKSPSVATADTGSKGSKRERISPQLKILFFIPVPPRTACFPYTQTGGRNTDPFLSP